MKEFLKRIFHRHQWTCEFEEYLGDGRYHVVSYCPICGKHKSYFTDINS